MKKVLVLFAHPKFEKSRANTILVNYIRNKEGVTFHDLYEEYPDFHIDVSYEKKLLEEHDVIVWHHPMYWYSCPPLLKQWIDMVLEFNCAYGPKGKALTSKICLNAITTGGSKKLCCSQGSNSYTITEFLRPFEQTANLCLMNYRQPFTVMGTYRLTDEQLSEYGSQYSSLIDSLQNEKTVLST